MCYYDLRFAYKNGFVKTVFYSCKDYAKALRHAHLLDRHCKIVYFVDGNDYRVSFESEVL